jgi:sugar O-acyltransferase (sialic acid O-acetyltransferase NeuD family)
MRQCVVMGAGGHGKVIIDILERQGDTTILGLIDSQRRPGERFQGYPVLGDEELLPELIAQTPALTVIVAVGHNWRRRQVVERLRLLCPEIRFGCARHPTAVVAGTARIGAGTVIMAGAIIGPDVQIGEHCIVNHRCSIDHDSALANFSSLAPGVVTGGYVTLGEGAAVNTGAVLARGAGIGTYSVIGAGATVLGEIGARTLAYGTPAKPARTIDPQDSYF